MDNRTNRIFNPPPPVTRNSSLILIRSSTRPFGMFDTMRLQNAPRPCSPPPPLRHRHHHRSPLTHSPAAYHPVGPDWYCHRCHHYPQELPSFSVHTSMATTVLLALMLLASLPLFLLLLLLLPMPSMSTSTSTCSSTFQSPTPCLPIPLLLLPLLVIPGRSS